MMVMLHSTQNTDKSLGGGEEEYTSLIMLHEPTIARLKPQFIIFMFV